MFFLFFFLCFLVILILKLRKPSSQLPPGPPPLPFIGNLHQIRSTSPHIYLSDLAKKYGPLMHLKLGSIPLIVISSSKVAKQVLKTHDLVFSSRPKLLGQHHLSYHGRDVAFAPFGESWRELRKICVLHLLSNKQVQSFRTIREEEVYKMIKNLSINASLGGLVNLSTSMLSVTSNLICRVAFSRVGGKSDYDFKRFDELMFDAQEIQGSFFVSDFLPWFGWMDKVSGKIEKMDKICKVFDEFYEDLIADHLDPDRLKPKNPDILDILIRIKGEKTSLVDLTWDHIKAIVMNIFVAGTDSGAATIVWIMTVLVKNPTVLRKLQNHIREVIGEEKGRIDENNLHKLVYLTAVIKEALRLYPPAPLLLPRESIEECIIEGYTIPPKSTVYINAWAIGRDPKCWENPNDFIPERFLNNKIDIVGQDFEVIPFGAGRRGCPGIAMGIANVDIVVANLVYFFDWELPTGVGPDDVDTEVLPGLTMHKKNPLCLVPKSRINV